MPNSAAVAQYLPFLRRYARALTGNQASGDAYVAATLEALIADRSVLEDPKGPRVALYRLFTKIWNSLSVNGTAGSPDAALPGEQKLANITPLPRQAFLLVALEGFSEPDAARVLDIDVMKLRGLVEESGRELAVEIATEVLIIEDDTFIAMELETLVEGLGHRVLGVARTHAEALALTKKKRPGLILADIQLGRWQLGPGGRERVARHVRGAGDLHHGVSRTFPHRRAARAGLPDRQAVPAGNRIGGCKPGAVLRADSEAARPPRHRVMRRVRPRCG